MDLRNIKVYSKTGDFLRSISFQEYGENISSLESYDSKLFVYYFLQFGDDKYEWIILDTLGNLIKKKERTIPTFKSNWGEKGGTYKYGNWMSYWNPFNDTVFSILPDLSYKASFIFSPGEHRFPKLKFDSFEQYGQYMHLNQIFETSRFLAIRYSFKKAALC